MAKRSLLRAQLERRMDSFRAAAALEQPAVGWITATRNAIGMTLKQLAEKTGQSRQGIADSEKRESEGLITIKALKELANAMDMDLVYGFIPKDGTLDALIQRKATELAKQIVLRTSNTMKLEDQQNSEERIRKAIEEKTAELKYEMPKILWD